VRADPLRGQTRGPTKQGRTTHQSAGPRPTANREGQTPYPVAQRTPGGPPHPPPPPAGAPRAPPRLSAFFRLPIAYPYPLWTA